MLFLSRFGRVGDPVIFRPCFVQLMNLKFLGLGRGLPKRNAMNYKSSEEEE
jgi:hypothetical protein